MTIRSCLHKQTHVERRNIRNSQTNPLKINNTPFITANFKNIKDPRINRKKQHYLTDSISLAVIGIISGADSWD
jgi:hypothetical protein